MDRKLYMDSFERLLKEKSDEFRMYPTKRTWHSIYNNIYPGRKWPSATISILLLCFLPFIGFLNTSTQHTAINKNTVTDIPVGKGLAALTVSEKHTSQVSSDNKASGSVSYKSYTNADNTKSHNTIQVSVYNHHANRFSFNMLHDKNSTELSHSNKEYSDSNSGSFVADKNSSSIIDNSAIDKNIAAENYALQNEEGNQKRS